MPIITNSEVKTLLQDSSIDDTLLNMLIPMVENAVVDYCLNEFIDTYMDINGITPTVYTYSNTIYFQNSDNSINDDTNDFTSLSFKANDIVRVYNSINNDKMFTIDSITANKIIINDLYSVNDESLGNTIVIARVLFPDHFKLIASQMIKFGLQKYGFYKSEKIDDYSYTLKDSDNQQFNGFPLSVMSGLNDYRSMYKKSIPFNLLYYRQL